MLWLKGWLETRSRVVFALLWALTFLLLFASAVDRSKPIEGSANSLPVLLNALALVWVFVPVWLAGSGIRTQPPFGRGARGLHGSTQFTLSLPVSRTRLLLVRATLGLLETAAVIVLLVLVLWTVLPRSRAIASPGDWLMYVVTVLACGAGVYGVALVAATLVDDVWVIPVSTVAIILLWGAQSAGMVPRAANIFRPMAESSPLVTHALPWNPMAIALVMCGVGVVAALWVARRQEF
jgi:hypothetical protein